MNDFSNLRKLDPYWDLSLSIESFEESVRKGLLLDQYGYAEYVVKGYCSKVYVYPSEYSGAPEWATGVIWRESYNGD